MKLHLRIRLRLLERLRSGIIAVVGTSCEFHWCTLSRLSPTSDRLLVVSIAIDFSKICCGIARLSK
jgi:hypothetical protein